MIDGKKPKECLPVSSVCISNRSEMELSISSSEESTDPGDMERGQWSNKLDFLISVINYAVGLGNVWRFPYLCYENGGGVFLVPYLICLVLLAGPSFVMEVAVGQYFRKGGIGIWKLCPILKGIGYASMTIVALYNIYFIIVVSWVLFYFVNSFTFLLPWQRCDAPWNTPACTVIETLAHNATVSLNASNASGLSRETSSVVEFWERKVLGITDGIHDMGGMRWELVGLLILGWVVIYFIIWKGLNESGKLIYVTATFPYVILVILLIRGVTLEGAGDGILYFVQPRWEKLLEPKVWVAAGTQVFFTFGIGFGSVVNLGSYNKFTHNFYRDSIFICILNPLTSILAGVVIFSVLGYMANVQGVLVDEVVKSGPGLAFLTYPEVVLHLPLSPLWAGLFFLMLFVLGINSQFCTVEALVSSLVEEWPHLLIQKRKLFSLFMCVIMCILGLPMVTEGGMYIFQLMDFYAASGIPLLFTVFFQTIAIAWIYGIPRLSKNIKTMIGFAPGLYLKLGWLVLVPMTTFGIFMFCIIDYTPLVYAQVYTYPWWGEMLGWLIALSSMIWIPFYAFYFICYKTEGTLMERIRMGMSPALEDGVNKEVPKESILVGIARV
ncbi:sodium- and chloride-dependent GABA transporter 2-like [Argiope bruennichi]|uniref:sodium- and chloride-dependent GABA transporter 2-like n=1 Tax=Argiope bruennichi TaxID=94029 RepID=UPI0024940B1E|nr:sodium- and chloride-dependent GABA transporter 2-like [Argiope bruennichi]XP_055935397.1 sodium- and chloride-dependent GABA transporter 2-like [Argiope bruennichi]